MDAANKDILWRVHIIFVLMCLFGIGIICKVVTIQFVEGKYWKNRADSLTLGERTIEAQRGNIYSSDGSLLTTSMPIYEMRMDMKVLDDKLFYKGIDSLSLLLSQLFEDKSPWQYKQELVKARKQEDTYKLLQRNVSYTQYKEMKTWPLFRLGRFKSGLRAEKKSKREKPFQTLASRTLGYAVEGIQPVGIEGAFDKYLKGISGKKFMRKISGNTWMPLNDDNEIEPHNGNDIVTTLDINIQDVASNALRKQLIARNAEHGCAVVMEVSTGEIKAIANLEKTNLGEYEENYNYAVGENAQPGSTFKLMALMAALDDQKIKLTDSLNLENGKHLYFDSWMKDAEVHSKNKVTLKEAFEISSNVGISKAICNAYGRTPNSFIEKLYKMNLNQSIGLQIPGEATPYIKKAFGKNWSGTSLPWISIGYEISMTPLQILTFYNAVANNGKMIKPLFVKAISEHGKTIKSFSSQVINEAIASPSTIAKAKMLLEGVVENGTAKNIKSVNYKIAGKTGTAQIADSKHKSHDTLQYQASFVGYFPADHPKYSIIVVINSPKLIYYAAQTAAPVFKEIADKIYSTNLDLRKETIEEAKTLPYYSLPEIKSGDKSDLFLVCKNLGIGIQGQNTDVSWVNGKPGIDRKNINFTEKKIRKGETPNVIGMGMRDAVYMLENVGLRPKAYGRGSVIRQSPMPGSKLEKGQQIHIFLG